MIKNTFGNVAGWDSYLRLLLGTLMLAWGFAGGPVWAYFGLYLIISGGWRFCAIYSFLGVKTS